MREDYTHIAVILDRSGSMYSICTDVNNGFNSFVQEQKETEGKATLSLVQFSYQCEVVHNFIDIGSVPNLNLNPSGGTALLDAMGKTLSEVRETVLAMEESEMPSRVIFLIITDGAENASTEYTRETVFQMIDELKSEGREDSVNWDFVFIGANQDAISEGANIGISRDKSLTYDASSAGATMAFSAMSRGVSSYRKTSSSIASYSFLEDDRKLQEDINKGKTSVHAQAIPHDLIEQLEDSK